MQAEHFSVDYDCSNIVMSYSAKTLVVDDVGAERAALFSFHFKDRACGRKQVSRSLFNQRTMLNVEICKPIDLS